MKKDDYKDIEKLFSKQTPLPRELLKENIVQKLEHVSQNSKPKKHIFKKVIAAAAAVAVVATSALSFGYVKSNTPSSKPEKAALAGLSTFSSNEELSDYYKKALEKTSSELFVDTVEHYRFSENEKSAASSHLAPTEAAAGTVAPGQNPQSSQNSAYGKTNIQIQGVDEADIIKNDGRYIYVVSQSDKLIIVDAETLEVVWSKKLKADSKKDRLEIQDIYVNENTLVAVCNQWEKNRSAVLYKSNDEESGTETSALSQFYCGNIASSCGETVNIVFDISNRSAPKEIKRVTQDGNLVSTRMVGSVIYTVTNFAPIAKGKYDDCLPKVNGEALGCNEIYVENKESENSETVIITALDTQNTSSPVGKVSIIGSANSIFCTNDKLYVTESVYLKNKDNTKIHSFRFDKTNISYAATGAVPGTISDQYCINEQNGYLFVAANDYNYIKEASVSSLYVLDENLKQVASLFNFAPNEEIQSVRFVGSTAYIVTFEQTDPLFAIDLSSPKEPKILGQIKLPGFSEYLHPISDSLIVGIGYDGDEENADYSSIKISLFDVSNKSDPKEISKYVIKNASTDTGYDPKAFLSINENSFAIPVLSYDANDNLNCKMTVFEIRDSKLLKKQTYTHPEKVKDNDSRYYTDFFRGTFINNSFYTVDNYSIAKFDLASAKLLSSQTFAKPE